MTLYILFVRFIAILIGLCQARLGSGSAISNSSNRLFLRSLGAGVWTAMDLVSVRGTSSLSKIKIGTGIMQGPRETRHDKWKQGDADFKRILVKQYSSK